MHNLLSYHLVIDFFVIYTLVREYCLYDINPLKCVMRLDIYMVQYLGIFCKNCVLQKNVHSAGIGCSILNLIGQAC